jgi:ElaB/YqjD/DUF883 family membrane-anchored ribosome-binding protein
VVAVVIVIALVGIIGYAVSGLAYAATRISSADRTLNTVVSHQNELNATFKDIDTRFSALGTSSTFNPPQARALVDQFVSSSEAAGKTVEEDDAALATAEAYLREQPWFTTISRANLDKESKRIAHARKALVSAKTVAADYVLDGQFMQAFLDTLSDLDNLSKSSATGDLTATKATLASLKTHVDKALQMSTAPGLPPEMRSMMVDFQTLVSDFGKLIDASQANDAAAISAYSKSVSDDANKLSSYSFDNMTAKINAFYKPLIDAYNMEMAAATL